MKKGIIQKNTAVKDDENYLQGINLVTGDKIDYAKHLLTQTQITAMCINEKLSHQDKFIQIVTHGQKIQKWSLFENLPLYIQNWQAAESILALIEKNYVQYEEFVSILGEGLLKYIKKATEKQELISKKCYDILYRLLQRTVTSAKNQGSDLLGDWMQALSEYFHFPQNNKIVENRKNKLNELKQYINGSFSMNTLPERRKTALQVINALLGQSQQIQKQAHSKILFFNNDLNPATRLIICSIIDKIIKMGHSNSQIWKCISDYYFMDKSTAVRDKAFQIMSQNYYKPNADLIFQELANDQSDCLPIITKYATSIFKTFEQDIRNEPTFQLKIISYLNRLIRQNMQLNIGKIVECYPLLVESIPQNILVQELELKKFNLQNIKLIGQLITFHSTVGHFQFKEQIKKQIMKGIRFHQFELKGDKNMINNLLSLFDFTNDQDVSFFILLFTKQIDNSKWKNIPFFLKKIYDMKLYQSQYQKITSCILRIFNNCPYFLLEGINQIILYLLLSDKKNMDIYQKLKEKYINSRCWSHRRNYIKLYAYFKINASYEFNRCISTLVYKNILNQKSPLIKAEFVRSLTEAYSYIDPTFQQQKNSIKDSIALMVNDKDRQLSELARNSIQGIKINEKDYELVHLRLMRNKELHHKEQQIQQVQTETKKHIKTEKLIPKDLKDKIKKTSIVETRTSINLMKVGLNLQKNKVALVQNKTLVRSNSSSQRQQDKKFGLPSTKKSRF